MVEDYECFAGRRVTVTTLEGDNPVLSNNNKSVKQWYFIKRQTDR